MEKKKDEILALMYDFYNQNVLRDQNKDIDYFIKQINDYKSKNVLVVGAGTGRVAIPLAEHAKISALDMDYERLKVLKDKCSKIETINCDFINFNNDSKYDLIIFPYSTIQFDGTEDKMNLMLGKTKEKLINNGISILDFSESFNSKVERNNELLFSKYNSEIDSIIKVYFTSKRYSDYIEFFVTYYVEKTGKSYLENERYYYYDKDKVERAIDNNGLELVKIDDGYAKKCLTNKHLFHVRR